jgi:hypothetical protein
VLAGPAAGSGVPAVSGVPAGSGAPARSGVRAALGWHELRDSGKLPNGTREVTVLIRPEQFSLSSFASSSAGPAGGVTGKVTEACRCVNGAR